MARKQGTIRIHADWWEPGEEVEIRSYLSHGAKKAIEAASLEGFDLSGINVNEMRSEGAGLEKAKIDLKKTMAAGEDASLLHMIVSWNLKDEHSNILPFEPKEALQQSLDELADEDTQFIKDALDGVTGSQMSPEERASFLAKLSGSIVA